MSSPEVASAPVFAALGDVTRLKLVERLSESVRDAKASDQKYQLRHHPLAGRQRRCGL